MDEPWLVAVKSARIPFDRWYSGFAHHTWIDVRDGGTGEWRRFEIGSRRRGVAVSSITEAEARGDVWFARRPIQVLGVVTGEEARRIAERIEEAALARHEEYEGGYRLWPGPNSNTFIAELGRELDGLSFVFDPNAIGKDYPGWFDAGLVPSRTGARIDTPILGAALALREGVELHFLGLTLGVSVWPPSLSIPFLPRIPGDLLAADVQGVPPPPPARRLTARVDLPESPLVERSLDDLPLRGRVLLVDSGTGAWGQVDYRFERAPDSTSSWTARVSTLEADETEDRETEWSELLDAPRPFEVATRAGRYDASLRFELAPDEIATLDVSARLRNDLDP